MNRDKIVSIFDQSRAENYDAQLKNLEPMHEALMLGMRVILGPLPEDASVLCVGVGTGTELIALAEAFPKWRFTAVEPAPAMMAKCKAKVESAGMADRCEFHEGYLESLSGNTVFHAATCLLVSHFFKDTSERRAFLHEIGERLRVGGILLQTDLSPPEIGADHGRLMDDWIRFMKRSNASVDRAAYAEQLRENVGLLAPPEMVSLLKQSGFTEPSCFFRMLMIGGWYSIWQG